MNNKFFLAYLIAASLALLLLIYQSVSAYTHGYNLWNLGGNIILTIALYYMAFKTYHEKKDKELM